MHLVIRADGGPDIGYGHLVRTGALAEELLGRGHTVTIATTTPQPAREVFPDTVEALSLPSRGDYEPFVAWLEDATPDAVFTDAYPVDTEYQRAVRESTTLAVLQDDARHAICADLFVNGNLYAADVEYEFVEQKPKTCLGTDYILLRSEIRDRVDDEPPFREQPERALVMMGGSDVANLMPTAIRAFDGMDIHVDAIIGPGFSEAQERSVRATVEEISADVLVARDPDDLVERMFQADFAVSTSSSTTYELLALGTPIVSRPVVDNQVPIARELCKRDAAVVLNRGDSEAAFRRGVETLLAPERRRTYCNRGQKLVDGRGTERVAREVLSVTEDNEGI